jgi:hypothetical protein
MPLSTDFDLSASLAVEGRTLPKPPVILKKRPAPFSLRLSAEERARLAVEAAGAPPGAYIKAKVLSDAKPEGRKRRKVLAIKDREALARALALLGATHFAQNLNQIAVGVNIGTLPVTPELEAELHNALIHVREIRAALLTALGHLGGSP